MAKKRTSDADKQVIWDVYEWIDYLNNEIGDYSRTSTSDFDSVIKKKQIITSLQEQLDRLNLLARQDLIGTMRDGLASVERWHRTHAGEDAPSTSYAMSQSSRHEKLPRPSKRDVDRVSRECSRLRREGLALTERALNRASGVSRPKIKAMCKELRLPDDFVAEIDSRRRTS